MSYPESPGWRQNETADTSMLAARAVKPRAPKQMQLVLEALQHGPASPEVITDRIRGEGHAVLLMSIRPRCSQLVRLGKIKDTGLRGRGEGGQKCIVWRLATAEEEALFHARKAMEEDARREAP